MEAVFPPSLLPSPRDFSLRFPQNSVSPAAYLSLFLSLPLFLLFSSHSVTPISLARVRRLSLDFRIRVRVCPEGMKGRRTCELCKGGAAVYCEADAAFLCWPCDARVHSANFLVARHLRRIACAECHALDDARLLSGAGSPPIRSLCRSCRRSTGPSSSDSTSASDSSCVSTADSAAPESARRGVAAKEGILINWSRRMGLGDQGARRCAAVATRVLRACSGKMAVMPLRISLAAALWFAVKRCGDGGRTCEGARLRALEACAGVPAKLIMVAESRLARATRRTQVSDEQEGSAESW